MKNILKATEENILKSAQIIQNGGLVAMPTETVYGLGANAFIPQSVAKIFETKNRPSFNPLISHISDMEMIQDIGIADDRFYALAKHFWPAPLTFVIKRTNPKLDLACAGLDSATVRMPNHPIALELIKKAGVPIVAPSANLSTTISPTTAQHVYESLGNKVDIILDGGACQIGVESTIIDLTTSNVVLLRAGGLEVEKIEEFLNEKVIFSISDPNAPKSPGQMLKHYAPNKKLRINIEKPQDDEFYIGFGDVDCHLNLSKRKNLLEASANLFAFLRLADKNKEFKKIAISPIPTNGLGLAINDRLGRAKHD
ncbi:MAG: L-threonylcarbamoyladenylate synthase [Alphaproteobacteria bacterium]